MAPKRMISHDQVAVRTRAAQNDDGNRHHGRPPSHHGATGTGSEVMQRIALPMIGAMVSSTLLTLIVIPAVYALIKGWRLPINLGALQHQGSLAAPSMAHWPAVLTSYGGRAALLCRESASGP